jgi:NH3-dependent NAD+ synthetase
MVITQVNINGETLEMWLPVMDGANKAMMNTPYTYKTKYGDKTVDAATMFDINKTLMRCLVKNLAMFGLGLYIYAGEDLPEAEPISLSGTIHTGTTTATTTEPKLEELKVGTENWDKVVKYVTANKALGLEAIGKQLLRKYKMSAAIKKEIANLISAE